MIVRKIRDINEVAGYRAKGIEEFTQRPPIDLVVTVCDEAAEVCPFFPTDSSARADAGTGG